jgi:ribosomal subunit interface protein
MPERPNVVVTFKDVESDERVREAIEKRCAQLGEEFPELGRVDLTLSQDGAGFTVHGHVTGKGRDVGVQADASELLPAVDRALDKVERQLRTLHDKRIFAQRREAQRDPPKKQRGPS